MSISQERQVKSKEVRDGNILAGRAVADAIRTSLGPRGMDKMICGQSGDVTITNDGATILDKMQLLHPAAKMLVDLAHAQDVEAGDGTTTVTIIAGALLGAAQNLLNKGVHPMIITEGFQKACEDAITFCRGMSIPVDFTNHEQLLSIAKTSLSSKVVSQYSHILAPIAVDAVLKIADITSSNVDLKDIRIVKKLGGTIDDTTLIEGIVFNQHASHQAGGPTRIENAKIGIVQFQLSSPKTNIDMSTTISNYQQIDRALKQESQIIFKMCKKIKDTGCNVLLIQKSILRDATNDLSLQFLSKMKIMVIKDVERDEIEFISKTIGAIPIASIEAFSESKLGSAKVVEEINTSGGKFVTVTGVPNAGKTVSVLIRGSNLLILDEAERSLHDALCVMRSLVKEKHIIVGGGAPEVEMSVLLEKASKTLTGLLPMIYREFADALEVIPYTLSENSGLHPIEIVTELRKQHIEGKSLIGINVKKGNLTNMFDQKVFSPLLVYVSALRFATQTVNMILKIDDIIITR
jgi:T-complex protein 1 subunit delta